MTKIQPENNVETTLCACWVGTMALQNLQQYGCQTENKLKEKSRDLSRNSSRFFFQTKMKPCSVADTKTVRILEF